MPAATDDTEVSSCAHVEARRGRRAEDNGRTEGPKARARAPQLESAAPLQHHVVSRCAMKLVHRTLCDKDQGARSTRALGEACSGTGLARQQRGVTVYACLVGSRRHLQIRAECVDCAYAENRSVGAA